MTDAAATTPTPTVPDVAVVILAAGAGTRMVSSTPKMLHQVAGRTMLGHALVAAAGLSPARIVTVVGHCSDQVTAAVKDFSGYLAEKFPSSPTPVCALQKEQNGTGDAVAAALSSPALEAFDGTIIVTNADSPLLDSDTLAELVGVHHHGEGAGVTAVTTTLDDPTGYGRIVRAEDGSVLKVVEQKDADPQTLAITEVNAGLYAFDAPLLRAALTEVNCDNAQGEFYLTDVVGISRAHGRSVRAHHASADVVAGVNDRVQLAAAEKMMQQRLRERAQRAGVTMIDPESVFLGPDVVIGPDTTILPGVQLWGDTTIGAGVTIGPDTTLVDCTVGDSAQVVRAHGSQAVIGDNATVGPFTYLRPGTVLGERGKLGGFVEAKNAIIGRGTKVPHLTYVGDATIGEESNIGASSVFVNYDGVNKHHTRIGSHVRTGSDTMFIAPVTVGDGAYSGAGTVIKNDVPAGALTVSSGKQRIIDGWVADKRPGTAAARAAARAQAQGVDIVDPSGSDATDGADGADGTTGAAQ